jgi:hypothetical protein
VLVLHQLFQRNVTSVADRRNIFRLDAFREGVLTFDLPPSSGPVVVVFWSFIVVSFVFAARKL